MKSERRTNKLSGNEAADGIDTHLVYARHDQDMVDDLIHRLSSRLIHKDVAFRVWKDRYTDLGDDWDDAIKASIERAEMALLMLSPMFLNRNFDPRFAQYIHDVEMLEIERRGEQIARIPIALVRFDSDDGAARGYERFQTFFLRHKGGDLTYEECETDLLRNSFALELSKRIKQRLKKHGRLR